MQRLGASVGTSPPAAVGLVLSNSRRFQGVASRAKRSFENPLSGKDPALRSVMVPDAFHRSLQQELPRSASDLRERAMKAMDKRLAEELIWPGVTIRDKNNPLVDAIRKARNNPAFRNSRKMIVAGGRLFLEELARSKVYPETLLLPSGAEAPAWTKKAKCEIVHVSEEVAQSVDPGGDGYIGNYKMPDPPGVEEIIGNKMRLDRVLVLDNVSDPGNLGTLLRTASAFAYDAILLTNHCADLYHHAVVRAARGVHFMKNVKVYVVRDENGDDTFGMINHIVTRNDLNPVAYTPMPFLQSANRLESPAAYDEPPGKLLPASLFGTRPKLPAANQTQQHQKASPLTQSSPLVPAPSPTLTAASEMPAEVQQKKPSVAPSAPSQTATAKKLFSFMVDNFVSTAKPSGNTSKGESSSFSSSTSAKDESHFADKGFMLFAGPDVKTNMVRRLEQRVSKPCTVLELDEPDTEERDASDALLPSTSHVPSPTGDLMTALPAIMYALRPNGHWDYSLPHERHNPNVTAASNSRVQIGPDYLMVEDPPETAEEQEARAMDDLHWRKNKRLIAQQRTDEGFWLEAQAKKNALKGELAFDKLRDPVHEFTGAGRARKRRLQQDIEAAKLAHDIPAIDTDFTESVDRDFLRHERDNAESIIKSQQSTVYGTKMWYENASGDRRRPK